MQVQQLVLNQVGQHTWKIWKYLGIPKTFFYTWNYLENPLFPFLPGNTWNFSVCLFVILLSALNLKLLNFNFYI